MKKFILFMGCLALLVAGCNKEQHIEEPKQETPRHLTFDIAVNYSDDTRAVKTAWEENDKIYVFFDFDESTKVVEYMTMTFDGTSWSHEFSNETMEAALLEKTEGTLCAVYFPIGTPNFSIREFNGFNILSFNLESDIQTFFRTNFSSSTNDPYTIDAEGKLTAELNMSLGAYDIQFFVPGIAETEVDNYLFSCNNMEPTYPYAIYYNISTKEYLAGYMNTTFGEQMKGYFYVDGVVFSGQLLASASTGPSTYSFEITDNKGTTEDTSDDVKYTLTVPYKELHFHDAVKLPALNSGRWTIEGENYINGHEYVDLGLSVKWATMNVGASSPEDYGDYFAWGETTTKPNYYWYYYAFGDQYSLSKYNLTDQRTTLQADDDAATSNWGEKWRMPKMSEWRELLNTKDNTDEYTWTWCNGNDVKYNNTTVKGWMIVRTSNSATLFLPGSGRMESSAYRAEGVGNYWSSELMSNTVTNALDLFFNSSGGNPDGESSPRCYGYTVRPVSD